MVLVILECAGGAGAASEGQQPGWTVPRQSGVSQEGLQSGLLKHLPCSRWEKNYSHGISVGHTRVGSRPQTPEGPAGNPQEDEQVTPGCL